MSLSRWRIYCTESGHEGWQYVDSATPPTGCPGNPSHSVNSASINVEPSLVTLETLQDDKVVFADVDGNRVFFPTSFSKTVVISKEVSSGQYTTIREAIDDNNVPGMIFIVQPGVYFEANPLLLPEESLLISAGTTKQVSIIATDPMSDLLVLKPWSKVGLFFLIGAAGPGARGVFFDGAGTGAYSLVQECIIVDCNIAMETCNGPDTLLAYRTMVTNSMATTSKAVYAHSGGQFTGSSIAIQSLPTRSVADGISCVGAGSKVSLTTSNVWFCDHGTVVDDDGEIELNLLTTHSNRVGIHVGSTGTSSMIHAKTLNIRNSEEADLEIVATDASVSLEGILDESKIINPNKVKVSNRTYSDKFGRKYQVVSGDIRFGGRHQKTSVSIGEGKYDNSELVVQSGTDSETGLVDNSVAALDLDPPAFDVFQSTTAGSCCYIGRDTVLVGCKLNVTVATSSPISKGDVAWEYWNGSTWEEFKIMITGAESPFYYQSESVFSSAGKYHIRFGHKSSASFADKDIGGFDRKWIRIRIINDIPSIPQLEYVHLHVSETKIGSTGFLENFGDSRPVKKLDWTLTDTFPANASPANQDVYLSDRLGVGRIENRFNDGVVDRLGMNIFLPMDVDISFPVKLKFIFIGDSGTTGDVHFTCRWNTSNVGSTIHRATGSAPTTSAGEGSYETTVEVSASDTAYEGEMILDINDVNPYPETGSAQLLWVSFERDATGGNPSDTYPGHITLVQMTPVYISWRLGGHIESF